MTETSADRALARMKEKGAITSHEMRAMGMKKPSNVITKLRRRGLLILSEIVEESNGRKMAIYTLIQQKPPRLEIRRQITLWWKWRAH